MSVPAHDGLGPDDDQDLLPARPGLAQQDPEGAIQRRELGPPPSIGEDGELLAESQLDEGLLTLAADAGPQRVEQGDREREQYPHGVSEPA